MAVRGRPVGSRDSYPRMTRNAKEEPFPEIKRRSPIKATLPVMIELLTIIDRKRLKLEAIAIQAGYAPSLVAAWRRGERNSSLLAFIDVANFLGYDVTLTKKG